MNKFQSWLMANKNLLITSVVMCQVLVNFETYSFFHSSIFIKIPPKKTNTFYIYTKRVHIIIMANKNLLITSVVMCQVLVLSIGIINFPYIDDTGRQIDGNTDFARSQKEYASITPYP
jgi:hypothetical protein